MKYLVMIALVSSFVSSFAYAVESKTDCPMMREDNKRVNTKQNLSNEVKTPVHVKGSKAKSA